MSESKQQLAPWPWRWDDTPWEKYDPMERAPWLVDAEDHPVLSGEIKCKDEAHGRAIAAAPELVEALQAIAQYGSDTLSGRIDGPDDREWQREAVLEMTRRARAALAKAGA